MKGIHWIYSADLWVGYLNCDCKVEIIETTGSKSGEYRSNNPNTPLFVIGDISMGNPFSSVIETYLVNITLGKVIGDLKAIASLGDEPGLVEKIANGEPESAEDLTLDKIEFISCD